MIAYSQQNVIISKIQKQTQIQIQPMTLT